MIEKLTTVGDVFTLRNENFSLKEELNEIKRKEQAQNKEIQDLRKMISNLEREVRSLKDGFGPFPTASTISSPRQKRTKAVKKSSIPERKTEERRGLDSPLPTQQQEETGFAMEVEPLFSDIPGCSTDIGYMNRDLEWSHGEDTTSWTTKTDTNKIDETNTKSKTIRNVKTDNTEVTNVRFKITYDSNSSIGYIKKSIIDGVKARETNKPNAKGIRIIENKQLCPPSLPSPGSSDWVSVRGRDRRMRVNSAASAGASEPQQYLTSTKKDVEIRPEIKAGCCDNQQ